jgi:molecular chaperone GrpE
LEGVVTKLANIKDKNASDTEKEEKEVKRTKSGQESKRKTTEVNYESDLVEAIQDEIGELLSIEKNKYLRLAAEYDNFRKRSAKERDMIYTDARIDAISKILPVYDNLERALKMECSDESYYKGVEMIMTQLTEVLNSMGVKEIPAVGEPFDPNLHNAVMKIEDPNLGENIIAEEFQKGFAIGDRVIRFSSVVVAN